MSTVVPPPLNLSRHKSTEYNGAWKKAQILVAKRRAIEVSLVSLHKILNEVGAQEKFSKFYKDLQLRTLEMDVLKQKIQIDLINILDTMNTNVRIDFLFTLIDVHKNNVLTKLEIARIFQIVRGKDKPFQESLEAAQLSIYAHGNGDQCLPYDKFVYFIEDMSNYADTTPSEFVERLIIDVTVMQDEHSIKQEAMVHTSNLELTTRKRVTQREFTPDEKMRIYVLFRLIDVSFEGREDGVVLFKQAVEAVAPLWKIVDEEFHHLLFFRDSNEEFDCELDFVAFKEFFDNIMGACPTDICLDHIANIMTQYFVEEDHQGKRSYDKTLQLALSRTKFVDNTPREDSEETVQEDPIVLDLNERQQISGLFDLWDTDNTDSLDIDELFLGFRKFQNTNEMDDTLEDVINAMKSVQDHREGPTKSTIDLDQFQEIMVDYATETNIDLMELVRLLYYCTIQVLNEETETGKSKSDYLLTRRKSNELFGNPSESFPNYFSKIFQPNKRVEIDIADEDEMMEAAIDKKKPDLLDIIKFHVDNLCQEEGTQSGGSLNSSTHSTDEDGPTSFSSMMKSHIKKLAQEEVK